MPAAVLEAAPSRAALDQHAARQWEVLKSKTLKPVKRVRQISAPRHSVTRHCLAGRKKFVPGR